MAQTDKDDIVSILEDDLDNDIPNTLPLLPVRDIVVFTDMILPLFIGREKSIMTVEEAITKDRFLFLAAQKKLEIENPEPDDIFKVGTVGKILRMLKLPDGHFKLLVQGIAKAKIIKFIHSKPLFYVNIEKIAEDQIETKSLEIEALMRNVRENSERILTFREEWTGDIATILKSIEDPGKLADLVASNMKLKVEDSQTLLEFSDPVERLKKVNEYLSLELDLSSMQAKIQSDVRDEISKNQRDYFLREQMRAIHKELGELDEKTQEIAEYKKKIKQAKMPKEAENEANKQLKRLDKMHPDSAESSIVRTYLDWLTDMPWSKLSKNVIDIKKAKKILDENHYGLDKIKDRILEYLSVRKLNPKMKGPILCFVGPPGVGKTSLGQAIARATKRNFVRISLGGIRDEAEIRGHRRTYIGAMPGRILQGLKQAGTGNPVFMMDEIDKIGADFRGDPSSALLEALDPEQNFAFSDHYINLPFDLSRVMFILTANLTDTIPSALLDRMEIISLSGYTEEEKTVIAKTHLFPRQIKENGLKKRKIAEGEKRHFTITRNNLGRYLGVPKYLPEIDQEDSQIGLSTGLAWTQAGGEPLYIEASLIKGKGDLIITGQLGDVMQFAENMDIHIHVPAGAIPKDGPSAGIAMATALISALTNKPINKDVAMTGEITLRGRVLPIGGLKEKSLGALRAGICTIIFPEKNKKDLIEIPKNVKYKIKFVPVKNMDEVDSDSSTGGMLIICSIIN